MLTSVLAIVKDGKIETLEHIELSEGQKVLITMLPDDDIFWQEASGETLKQIWDNKEDDVYARLLVTRARALRVEIGSSPIQAEEIKQSIATGRP